MCISGLTGVGEPSSKQEHWINNKQLHKQSQLSQNTNYQQTSPHAVLALQELGSRVAGQRRSRPRERRLGYGMIDDSIMYVDFNYIYI